MVNHIRRRLWVAAGILAVYWLALFTLTHVPGEAVQAVRVWDKAAHFGAYFGLAVLLAWVLHGGRRSGWLKYAATLAICAAYAALDEVLQAFVHRTPDFFDWLADMSGAGCGLVFHWVAMQFAPRGANQEK